LLPIISLSANPCNAFMGVSDRVRRRPGQRAAANVEFDPADAIAITTIVVAVAPHR
jgi:hypothetical protein